MEGGCGLVAWVYGFSALRLVIFRICWLAGLLNVGNMYLVRAS